MQNSEQPDNQFLVEKKDGCCGKKCGCHQNKPVHKLDATDNELIDIVVIGAFIVLVGVVVAALSFF